MGGSDQWGNITAGIELVRRLRGKEVYGLTMPLVTNVDRAEVRQEREGQRVARRRRRTPPYDFYQFFFRVDDRDVGRFLRYFTFLDETAIRALETEMRADACAKREAQRALAREVTRLVHGDAAVTQAETELPATAMALPKPLVEVLVECGLCKSKSDARRQIEQGGVYVDGQRIDDVGYVLVRGGDASARQARQARGDGGGLAQGRSVRRSIVRALPVASSMSTRTARTCGLPSATL